MTTLRILGYSALVVVAALSSFAQDDVNRGRIEGEIRTSSGAPVSGATARLGQGFSTVSGTDGHFVIENVLAGYPYTLVVEAPGYPITIYGASGIEGGGTPISVQSGGVAKVKVVISPAGSLSGKVVDDDGNPIPRATVSFAPTSERDGVSGGTAADEKGEFYFSGLREGNYYLSALAVGIPTRLAQGQEYVETYFPNSADRAGAAVLHVVGGVDLPGNTIVLRKEKSFAIRGIVQDLLTGKPAPDVHIYAHKEDARTVHEGVSSADGAIAFTRITPGTYTFQIPYSGRQSIPTGSLANLQVVVRDSDVSDVLFSFQPAELITGKITTEDDKPFEAFGVLVTLAARNPARRGAQVQIKKDLTFEMRLSPDSYVARVYSPDEGKGYFLSQIKLDGVDLKLSSPINIPPGGGSRIELVLSPHAGKIAGTVNDEDGKPLAGLMVLARPKTLKQGVYRSGTVMSQANQDGKFQIPDVPPGDYYVTTVSDLTAIAGNLDAFLDNIARKSEGREEVTVSADSTASVTLKVK